MSRRALFICGTPFHVISSIILQHQLGIEADIIIYDAFANIDKLTASLKSESIFGNIRVLNKEKEYRLPKSLISRYIYAFLGYFRIKRMVSRVMPEIKEYSDVYFANAQVVDVIDRYNYCYLKKYYPEINLHFVEEGWDCYDEKFYELTTLDYIFRKFVVRGKTHVLDATLHTYSLDLYKWMNPQTKRTVVQIQKPDSVVFEKLRRVFSYYSNYDLSSYDVVLFDTVRDEVFTKEGSEKFNKIVQKLVENKKVIVKSHPRETERYFDYDYFETEGFPFEILCLFNNFDDFVFINNGSSAVFNPKLVFEQEPKLIFTYRVLSKNMKNSLADYDSIIDNFKKLYRDDSKIVVLDE